MIVAPAFLRYGISRSTNTSIPGFCNPIAFNIPPYTSATLGTEFPGHGTLATPLVVTAPNLERSTNSLNSSPEPNVPDPVVTGFFIVTPAISTDKFIIVPPPWRRILVHLCKHVCYEHVNGNPRLLTCKHRLSMHRFHIPFSLPWKSVLRSPSLLHML